MCGGTREPTSHSRRTELHHMPSTNPIASISHPILGSFSKQRRKKQKKEEVESLPERKSFPFSPFGRRFSLIDEDVLGAAAGLPSEKWSRGFDRHRRRWEIQPPAFN